MEEIDEEEIQHLRLECDKLEKSKEIKQDRYSAKIRIQE